MIYQLKMLTANEYELKMFRDTDGKAYYRIVDSKGSPVDPTRVEYDYNTDSYRIKDEVLNEGKGYVKPVMGVR